MRQGRTFKRCQVCTRGVPADRRRCPHPHPAGKEADRERIVWAFQVDLNAPGAPRRQRQGSGYATRGAAVAAMREAQSRADAGEPEPTRLTTGQWLERWLPSMRGRVRGGSWVGYELAVRRHLAPRLGATPLRSLTRAHVRAAYADMEAAGLSVKTVHNVHMVLRRALRDAVSASRRRPPEGGGWTSTRRPSRRCERTARPRLLAAAEPVALERLFGMHPFRNPSRTVAVLTRCWTLPSLVWQGTSRCWGAGRMSSARSAIDRHEQI